MRELSAVSADLRRFLGRVRQRLRRTIWAGGGSLVLALTAAVALAVILLSASITSDSRMALVVALALVGGAGTLATVVWLWRPIRALRTDHAVARLVGERVPEIRSDLLSAVELGDVLARPGAELPWSAVMARKHLEGTAARVAKVDEQRVVPRRVMRQRALSLLAVGAAYALVGLLLPERFAHGLDVLTKGPRPHPYGAIEVPEPILGDIELTLSYPAHTHREPRVYGNSSGDVSAPPGTEVKLRARVLRLAREARLIFEDAAGGKADARATLSADAADEMLSARFLVGKSSTNYRILMVPPKGPAIVEARAHRVEVEPDRPPRVELYAPADKLELDSHRRIELGYTVDDDYGLSEIALIYRSGQGRDERKVLPLAKGAGRSAQGRFEWNLAEIGLRPGVRVSYRLEAKDNDDVNGPNVGSSRTFYLKVSSPRQRHEELLASQTQLFEQMVTDLADRLERAQPAPPADARTEWLAARGVLHRGTEALTAAIARLHADLAADPLAPKTLRKELADMHGRLDKLGGDEAAELDRLDPDHPGTAQGKPHARQRGGSPAALVELGDKVAAELEHDTITLDDLLGRQRLEDLLAIGDEITSARDRIKKLMAELQRTGSETVRAELMRELAELESKLKELAARRGDMPAELADEYLNADAFKNEQAADQAAKMRDDVVAGNWKQAAERLLKLSDNVDKMMAGMEQGLKGLRDDKFSDEQKAFGDVMEGLADLEEDEKQIASDARKLAADAAERAKELAKDKLAPAAKVAQEQVDKLAKQVDKIDKNALTPFSQEQLSALKKRVQDVRDMLKRQDLPEAARMAREASNAARDMVADLSDDVEATGGWSKDTPQALHHSEKSMGMAEELAQGLEDAMPSTDELLGPQQKKALDELARRQDGVQKRARDLAKEAHKRGKELPGGVGQKLEQGLGDAQGPMERAEGRMKAGSSEQGGREADDAAKRLGELRGGMQRAARPTAMGDGDGGNDHEPVRIPGADDFKPPEEFRKDILEAMKESAPDAYREQVKRYYEELVK